MGHSRQPDRDLLKLAVVIPTLNEANNIQAAVNRYPLSTLLPCTQATFSLALSADVLLLALGLSVLLAGLVCRRSLWWTVAALTAL